MTAKKDDDAPIVQLKRQVRVKTLVNPGFREKAKTELSKEVSMIEDQLTQLEAQYQQTLRQLEEMAQQGQSVQKQLDGLNLEVQNRRNQLTNLKMEVTKQLSNLDKVSDGSYVVTGMLEGFVGVKVGDHLYDRIQASEILLEDGVVKEIKG